MYLFAKKHWRPYDGKHEDHERRWSTRNGSVVSSYPKQLSSTKRTPWRVCTARNAPHQAKRLDRAPRCPGPPGAGSPARRGPRARTGACYREWGAEHTGRCKWRESIPESAHSRELETIHI